MPWIRTEQLAEKLQPLEEERNEIDWDDLWDIIDTCDKEPGWTKTVLPPVGERVLIRALDGCRFFETIGWWTGTDWYLPEGNYKVTMWKRIARWW